MTIKRLLLAALAATTVLGLSQGLSAYGPCGEDARKFCPGLTPGGGRIAQCLAGHAQALAPECRDLLTRAGYLPGLSQAAPAATQLRGDDGEPVPYEYQTAYNTLQKILDDFTARLKAEPAGRGRPLIFGAELLAANCNRGTELLNPQAMAGVIANLEALRGLGVQAVTIPIHYPMLLESFPNSGQYLAFYKQVAAEVRARGMKLDIESAIVFANTYFSNLQFDFKKLTFQRYLAEKKAMVATIIEELHPDYLNLGCEPDTEAALTGLSEFNDPAKYTEYVSYVLQGLRRGDTRIAAGVGSWGNVEFARSLAANTSIDCLAVHVYPVIRQCLDNLEQISATARKYHKGLILDEAWLSKADQYLGSGNAGWSESFRRDVFGFWGPLDRRFLSAMVAFAKAQDVEYLSPFWTNYFFAYLPYGPDIASLPYKQMRALQAQAASTAMREGRVSPTGQHYARLIQGQ